MPTTSTATASPGSRSPGANKQTGGTVPSESRAASGWSIVRALPEEVRALRGRKSIAVGGRKSIAVASCDASRRTSAEPPASAVHGADEIIATLSGLGESMAAQQAVLGELKASMQDMRLDMRKQQDSVEKLSREVAQVMHGGGGEKPVPTASARQKMEAPDVDSVEDLGRLLAENADLDRLVTKVREAQQQLHAAGRVRLHRSGDEPEYTDDGEALPSDGRDLDSSPMARLRLGEQHLSCKALTLHPAGGTRIAWDALQLLVLTFSLLSLPLVLGFEDVLAAADMHSLRTANAAVDGLLLLDVSSSSSSSSSRPQWYDLALLLLGRLP